MNISNSEKSFCFHVCLIFQIYVAGSLGGDVGFYSLFALAGLIYLGGQKR